MADRVRLQLLPLALFAAFPCSAQNAAINGQVTNSLTHEPIPRAHVLLFNNSRKYGASTDTQGNFSFENVIPDAYQTTAERTGFSIQPNLVVDEANSVRLDAGVRHGSIRLELIPMGSVAGRVLDSSGEPIDGVSVIAVHGRIPANEALTDENGQFRLIGVVPGRYRIKAQKADIGLPPEIRTDGTVEVHYASTWYPDVIDRESGTRVEVRPGSETDGVVIRIAVAPIVGIHGKISGMPAGARDVSVTALHPGGLDPNSEMDTGVAPDGTFELWRLDPGKYRVAASGQRATGGVFQTAPEEVDIAGTNVDLQLTVVPPADINGRLEFEGEQPPQLKVLFNDIDGEDGARAAELDGLQFKVRDLPPSRFRVEVGQGAYVRSMRLGQTEVDGSLLDLRHQPNGSELVLMVSSTMARISGTVRDEKGAPAKAWLSLLPEDAIPGNFSFFSFVSTKEDGTYLLDGIAPGKYKLIVADNVAGFDASDYDDGVEEIEVHQGEKISKDLTRRPTGQ